MIGPAAIRRKIRTLLLEYDAAMGGMQNAQFASNDTMGTAQVSATASTSHHNIKQARDGSSTWRQIANWSIAPNSKPSANLGDEILLSHDPLWPPLRSVSVKPLELKKESLPNGFASVPIVVGQDVTEAERQVKSTRTDL